MQVIFFDLEWRVPEGARIVEDAEKIWCATFLDDRGNLAEFASEYVPSCLDMEDLPYWLEAMKGQTLIGHNILGADLIVMKRLLGIDFTVGADSIAGVPCNFVDTLVMSRTYNPDLPYTPYGQHGLAAWAYRLNGVKPVVEDWENLPIETYLHRCKADVILTEQVYNYLQEKRR